MSRAITTRAIVALAVLAGVAALAPVGCATSATPPDTSAGGAGGGVSATSTSSTGGTGGAGQCAHDGDCGAFTDACHNGSCVNNACVKAPKTDGAACDDGKYCTVADACQGGVCSGQPKSCPGVGPCTVGVCDLATDSCKVEAGNEGQLCISSDLCTVTAVCQTGQCVGVQQIDCSFLDDFCAIGVCDSNLGCIPQPANEGGPCDDGFFCTIGDACASGICSGAPKSCVPNGNPTCLIGSCSEAMQSCLTVPGNNGAACDDKNPCTAGETCGNGTCAGGVPVNVGVACDDKNPCTQASACGANGVCTGSSPIMQCVTGDACCPAGCTAANDTDCAPVNLILNGDFATNDLTSWSAANNPIGGNDVISTFDVNSQVAENVPSSGPSARVLTQDFIVPPQITTMATFSMIFFQDPSSPLDPQNVTIIEKDPFDQNADGKEQNAFRVDIIDPGLGQFDAPILFELYTPVNPVGAPNALVPVVVNDPMLLTFLQANVGKPLRLRFAQVESTFPWMLQFDNVSLIVQ